MLFNIPSLFFPTKMLYLLAGLLLFNAGNTAIAQVKILFDATKAESAGSADWVIDADSHNIQWSPSAGICSSSSCHQSNPQQIPTPAAPLAGITTDESYWEGGLSFWALDCAFKGYTVETLPAIGGRITYGDNNNPQDLSHYTAFIVCEPNIPFSDAEKTALLDFVYHGGGLFMIADHDVSDRNNDGWDSPHIWNDLMQINSTQNNNPFGFIFDYSNISETSSKIAAVAANDSIIHGAWGNVSRVKWSNGTTITVDPGVNPWVKPVIYRTSVSSASGNNGVMVVYSRYGQGKIAGIGDSSPCDDGTGDPNDVLYTGYNGDVTPNHRNLLMNATIWLVSHDKQTYTFYGNGNWSNSLNWLGGKLPPDVLPAGDEIIINPLSGGACILDVTQHISAGAFITVTAGKNFLVPGTLHLQ